MTNRLTSLLCLLAALVIGPQALAADPPRVVASIKPLHSLAAALTEGVSEPVRLLPDGASPHAYSLRPSDMRALAEADIVVWIGPQLEAFLERPLAATHEQARIIRVIALPALTTHPLQDLHAHHDHDGHAHGHAAQDEANAVDAHVWLDPRNALAVVDALEQALIEQDAERATTYRENAERLRTRLRALDLALAERMKGLGEARYVVFHDAYQYFERRYGLSHAAALTLDPARTPGARRVAEVRAIIRDTGARCVFAEPQFRPALVDTLIADTDARHATLDPIGSDIPAGPDAYPQLLLRLADNLEACLRLD